MFVEYQNRRVDAPSGNAVLALIAGETGRHFVGQVADCSSRSESFVPGAAVEGTVTVTVASAEPNPRTLIERSLRELEIHVNLRGWGLGSEPNLYAALSPLKATEN